MEQRPPARMNFRGAQFVPDKKPNATHWQVRPAETCDVDPDELAFTHRVFGLLGDVLLEAASRVLRTNASWFEGTRLRLSA